LITSSRGHELGDFACGEELRLTGMMRRQSDFREMLDDLHAEESSKKIGAAGDRAVISEKQSVVMRNIRFEDRAEIWGAGRGVTDQRNFAKRNDDFGEERLIESQAGSSETRSGGRMRVANRLNIGSHAIEEKMHAGFRRDLTMAVKVTALEVHDNEVIGIHHAFVDTGGSSENALGIETHGEIAFGRNNVAALVKPAANTADVQTMLFFGAARRGERRVRRHEADSFRGRQSVPRKLDEEILRQNSRKE